MRLPFAPPLAPMLSSAADALPGGEGWQFEPKWDGFRTLVFRDGDEILLQSRDEKPMNRYFPELIAPLAAMLSERCVVDGEIVIVGVGGLDFETLLLRIHPAASRVKLLSAQAPASFVAWDLLALGDDDLRNAPLAVRREQLEHVLAGAAPPVHLSPATRDRALAVDWFRRFEVWPTQPPSLLRELVHSTRLFAKAAANPVGALLHHHDHGYLRALAAHG